MVVKPALAIPFFTGVAAFIGNIVSLTKSIQRWQDAIVNKVLGELESVLNRIKPSLLDALQSIIGQIRAAGIQSNKAHKQLSAITPTVESSPLAYMSHNAVLVEVEKKLTMLKCSIQNNDITGLASNFREAKDDAVSAVRAAQSARQASGFATPGLAVEREMSIITDKVSAEVFSLQDKAQMSFRKLNESEMVLLLRTLWTSIRFLAFTASTVR